MINLDLTLNGSANLINLIHASNPGLLLNAQAVSFGVPQVYTPPSGSGSVANTSCLLTAINGSGFKDTVTIHYRRLSLASEVAKIKGPAIIPADLRNLTSTLKLIAGMYKLLTTELSWVSQPTIPLLVLLPFNVNLQIKTVNSLIYLDGQASVTITWDNRALLDLTQLGIPIKLGL